MAALARKRLLRDLAEVQREPSELVAAAPLGGNLLEWHANLRPSSGPLAGVVLHLRIVFPEDYPNSPPDMLFPFEAMPSFVHPNLYSFGLCLDILQSYIGERVDRAGWSTSYTVRTILLQLQSFLFEFDAAPQDHGGSYSFHYSQDRISKVRRESQAMTCTCGHCGARAWPMLLPPSGGSFDGSAPMQRPPSLAAQLEKVRGDILLAETQAAGALELTKRQPELARHSAYLSAWDVPVLFRAAVGRFHLRVVKVWGDRRWASVRTGFSADYEQRSAAHFTHSMQAFDLKTKGSRLICSEGCASGAGEATSAVLVLRNVQVCVETEGPHFVKGALPFEVLAQQRAAQGAAMLPSLRTQERDLEWRLEEAKQRQHDVEVRRLQAEEADLVKPLHDGAARSAWVLAPPGLLLQAFLHLDVVETASVQRACKVWRRLCTRYSVAERIELRCFYTKATAQEDILGFGITVGYHADGNIKEVGTELDVISASAFYEHKLRRGAWGGQFAHFLPLVLDADHARRAVPTLKRVLTSIVLSQPNGSFEPWMALAVLPQVMNSFVVSLMKEEDAVADEVPRHASEKALLGYCSFHHMLLALGARHPEIGEVATDRLRRFIWGERSKAHAPDLGQLLVYMAVAEDICWEELAAAVLAESHIRGVRWLLRERPLLQYAVAVEDRLRWSFEGRATSSRLLIFQAFFLRHIARPHGESLAASLARYDRQFGQPTGPQRERLVRACREILRVDGWPAVYDGLGLPAPEEQQLAEELCAAMHRSQQLGYHGNSTLLQGGSGGPGAPPERVGVKKCLRQAFQDMEAQKLQQKVRGQTSGRSQRSAVVPAAPRGPRVSRGAFAALQEDSDEDSASEAD